MDIAGIIDTDNEFTFVSRNSCKNYLNAKKNKEHYEGNSSNASRIFINQRGSL